MTDADDIMRRFEARRAGQVPERLPAPEGLEKSPAQKAKEHFEAAANIVLEQAAASAANAQPEEIKLPAQIRRGIVLFELEDGTFGAQTLPGSEAMTVEESRTLAQRHIARTIVMEAMAQALDVVQTQLRKTREAGAVGGLLNALKGGK